MKRLLLFLSALILSIATLWAHNVEIDGIDVIKVIVK